MKPKQLLAVLVLTLCFSCGITATAGAKYAQYIKVTPYLNSIDFCRPAPDQVKWKYTLKAKIKRKNVGLPKKVTMEYLVTDLDTAEDIVSQVLKLKPKKFYKVGKLTQYPAGHNIQFQLDGSFKSPIDGKILRKRSISNFVVPTAAEMDQANAKIPDAPPYPPCD
jgi:hypothetical protein